MTFEKALLIKGIHPGSVIAHVLKQKQISQHAFAKHLRTHPQSLNAIIKGKRKLNLKLALKIEAYFNWEKGVLMMLQIFYDIKMLEQENYDNIDISIFRPALFWDTGIENIDWNKNKKSIIKRVLSRGNAKEKQAVLKFYGQSTNDE